MFKKKKVEINLLPETQKLESLPKASLAYAGVVIGITIIVLLVVFAFSFFQKQQLNSLNKQINKLQTEGQQEVAKTAQLIAKTKVSLSEYKKFSSTYPDLNKRLQALERTIPDQVQLSELTIENDGKGIMKGQASNPDIIDAFYSAIEKDGEYFDEIKVASVAKGTDKYSFVINVVFKK